MPTSTFWLNQRTARTQSGTAFSATTTDAFTYNSKGELVLSENDTLTAREFGYNYDGIGNRVSSVVAGGTPTLYEVNAVNQYVEIEQNPNPAQTPTYDADGNQLTDGKGHTLVWDGENRLVEFFPASPGAGDKRVVNTYDGQSRRVKKQVYEWSSGWQLAKDEVFVYDGWNPVMIYDVQVSGLSPQLSLTWGRDLSASLQGAGGVGGLLATHDGTTQGIMFYDANGNIGQVMDGSAIIAHYEYDPFGNTINSTGTYADDNEFRFSTKFQDEETNLYYYGYRFYNPETGRWINRDPIQEEGGVNLYAFVANNPVDWVDPFGTYRKKRKTVPNSQGSNRKIDVIEVDKCEIVILYGHGDNEVPHEFKFPDNSCSGGEFVGCFPKVTNSNIPKANRLPNPDMSPGTKEISPTGDFHEAMKSARERARKQAKVICAEESKCCDAVAIEFVMQGGIIEWFHLPDYSSWNETIGCTEK